jgi:hypothetical protein
VRFPEASSEAVRAIAMAISLGFSNRFLLSRIEPFQRLSFEQVDQLIDFSSFCGMEWVGPYVLHAWARTIRDAQDLLKLVVKKPWAGHCGVSETEWSTMAQPILEWIADNVQVIYNYVSDHKYSVHHAHASSQ